MAGFSFRKPSTRGTTTLSRLEAATVGRPAATYPWWVEEALASGVLPAPEPPLVGRRNVDVAIVGGGYTGLWTALALREREPDLNIAVVEARTCGCGGSGRNGGFVHGYWESFGKLSGLFGREEALRIAEAGSEAQTQIARFAAAQPHDLWWSSQGIRLVATSRAQECAAKSAVRAIDDVPENVRPYATYDAKIGTGGQGVLFPEGATVQPARLLGALKTAVREAGVAVYETSPVVELGCSGRYLLRTPLGVVEAGDVVLGAGPWLSGTRPYSRHLTNLGSFAVVTEPVPEYLERSGLPAGFAVKDARMFLHWARTTKDGRIVVGTGAGPMSYDGRVGAVHSSHAPSLARCTAALRRFFPGIGEVTIEHGWGGPIDMSADRLPFFGTLPGTGIHYGLGYSGHGVNASWIGGQVLASLALGSDDRWTNSKFCRADVPKLPPEPFRFFGGKLIHRSSLAVEDDLDNGRKSSLANRTIATLPRLLGMRIGLR